MSDGYIYAGVDRYYTSERKTDNKTKILKILVTVLVLFVVVEAVIYTVIMPCLSSAKFTFTGLKNLKSEDLLAETGINTSVSWINFDTAAFATVLANNASIESVSVEKKFPDQILVKVSERTPVCCSLATINGKITPIQIDENGVIFHHDDGLANKSMPLITGLDLSYVSEGMRIPTKYRSLLQRIEEIWQMNPEYFSVLSEIRVIPTEFGSFELMLYPLKTHVKFLTDRNLSDKSLQYMMVMSEVISTIDPYVYEVDMRYGTVSFKRRAKLNA